jgi:uncharacterized protein (TIGR02145 family)
MKLIFRTILILSIVAPFLNTGCIFDDDEWDPNKYVEIKLNYDQPFYHFTNGVFARDAMPDDIDGMGIINEPWCTDLPALCGQFEVTDYSSFASLTEAPAGNYSGNCIEVPLDKVIVFKLNDGSFGLVKIVNDNYNFVEGEYCEHEITIHVNYPAFNQKKDTENENEKITQGIFIDDRDKKEYKTVEFNGKIWMAENLAYLPILSPVNSNSLTEPYFFVYDTLGISHSNIRNTQNYQTYGVLYNWAAANTVCPQGWHLPSEAEWMQLAKYISDDNGGYTNNNGTWENIGAHLKAETGWNGNGNGTDTYGFNGLPGGLRNINGNFLRLGQYASWWTASENEDDEAITYQLEYNDDRLHKIERYKIEGYSVRCVRKAPDESLNGLSDANWELIAESPGLVIQNMNSFNGYNMPLYLAGYRPNTMYAGNFSMLEGSYIERIMTPDQVNINDLFCYSRNEVFMCTDTHFTKFTFGYPPEFSPLVELPLTGRAKSIHFTTPSRGYIASEKGACLTIDGGNSWSVLNIGNEGFTRVFFPSISEGYILQKWGTEEGTLFKTTNGTDFTKHYFPLNWHGRPNAEIMHGLYFLNPFKGWICGTHGQIIATDDGGQTWKIIRAGGQNEATLFDIHFPNENEGWACGENGTLLYTNDGGSTWDNIDIGESNNFVAIEFNGPYCGWLATHSKIYEYRNNNQHGNQFY